MTTTEADRANHRREPAPAAAGGTVSMVASAMSRLASGRVWIVSASLFVVFAGLFFASSAPFAIPQVAATCGQPPPDVRFTSSAADVSGFLDACGSAGRAAYGSMQMADLLYPLVFGLFLATSFANVLARLAPGDRRVLALAALPLVGSAFDYLENAFAWLALVAYPDPSATGSLLGLASAAKSITFWVAGVALLVAAGALGVLDGRRWLTRRSARLGAISTNGAP